MPAPPCIITIPAADQQRLPSATHWDEHKLTVFLQAHIVRHSFRARRKVSTAEHSMQAARPQWQGHLAGCPCSLGRFGAWMQQPMQTRPDSQAHEGGAKLRCRACKPMHHALACEHCTTAHQSIHDPFHEGHRHPAGCCCSTGRSVRWRDAAACADTAASMCAVAWSSRHASPARARWSFAVRAAHKGPLTGGLTPALT